MAKLSPKTISTEIPKDTRSVWVTDYEGGGSTTTKTETSGTTGETTTTTRRTRSSRTGEIITPETTTMVNGNIVSVETAQPSFSDLKTQEDLRKEGERLQKYYQDLYNRRKITETKANTQLNKNLQEYQRRTYEQQGYNVQYNQETGEYQLERQVPTTTQVPITETKEFKLSESWFLPVGTVTTTSSTGDVSTKTYQYGLLEGIGKQIEQTEFGQNLIKKYPFLSGKVGEKQLDVGKISVFIKEMGITSFYSPAISTFAYSKKQQEIVKALSSNKFAGLTDQEKIEVANAVKGKVQKDLLMKKSLNEQLKYLNNIWKGLKTPEAKEGFKNLVKGLMEGGFIKSVPISIAGVGTSTMVSVPATLTSPTSLQATGILTGVSSSLGGSGTTTTQTGKTTTVSGTTKKTSFVPILSLGVVQAQGGGSGQKSSSSQIFIQPQPQPQPPIVIQPQPQIQRTSQRMFQPQASSQIFKFKQPQPMLVPKKTLVLKSQNVFKLSPAKRGLFEAFLKRKGKDISLGKFGEFGSAKTKFLKEVKTTLGASGFITKEGKAIPFKELKLGFEFKPSKKQPFRAVQKRGFRLGTRAEVQEIQKSRRNKVKWL